MEHGRAWVPAQEFGPAGILQRINLVDHEDRGEMVLLSGRQVKTQLPKLIACRQGPENFGPAKDGRSLAPSLIRPADHEVQTGKSPKLVAWDANTLKIVSGEVPPPVERT